MCRSSLALLFKPKILFTNSTVEFLVTSIDKKTNKRFITIIDAVNNSHFFICSLQSAAFKYLVQFIQIINRILFLVGFNADNHPTNSIEFIVSAKKKLQLVVDGFPFYRYTVDKNNYTVYRCVQYTLLGFVFYA